MRAFIRDLHCVLNGSDGLVPAVLAASAITMIFGLLGMCLILTGRDLLLQGLTP